VRPAGASPARDEAAAVAVVKAIAGVLTGSAALLAEAAHSIADTTN
jgi:divalent metal cation (Fe/Co/Zn/Cd) transporter